MGALTDLRMVCLGLYAVSSVFQLFMGDISQNHVSWTIFLPVLNQSITPTLAGQSLCYSNNPERQVGKPLQPVLKTFVCHSRGSNPRPPAHEADATRPPRR